MSKRLSRRLRTLLTALVVALPLMAHPLPAGASSSPTGTLFALAPTFVATANPSTGALTPFANLPLTPPTQPGAAFNGLASDPLGHRLFVSRTSYSDFNFTTITYQIVTIDTLTAAVSLSPDMGQAVLDMVFDPSSSTLYGHTAQCCPFQVVSIDTATGALTHVADLPGVQQSQMTIASSTHSIYMVTEEFALGQPQPVFTMLTVNATTGDVSQGEPMIKGAFQLAYDTASGILFGKTFCCPASLVQIDPGSGVETDVGGPPLGLGGGIAIDPASHTIFLTEDLQGAFSFKQLIQSINDETGASSTSRALPHGTYVPTLAFVGISATPDTIKADVQSAVADGAVTSTSLAASLVTKLNAASTARANGHCDIAATYYHAFIRQLNAQSGLRVAPPAARLLVGEARLLIANCP